MRGQEWESFPGLEKDFPDKAGRFGVGIFPSGCIEQVLANGKNRCSLNPEAKREAEISELLQFPVRGAPSSAAGISALLGDPYGPFPT